VRVHGSRNPAHPLGAFRYFPLRPLARISQFTPIISHLGPFRCGVQPPATRHSFPAWSNLTLTPIPELRCARTRKGPLCRSGGWGGEQHTGLKRPRCSPNPTFRFCPNATSETAAVPHHCRRTITNVAVPVVRCIAWRMAWCSARWTRAWHFGRRKLLVCGSVLHAAARMACATSRVRVAPRLPVFWHGPRPRSENRAIPAANYAAQTLQ